VAAVPTTTAPEPEPVLDAEPPLVGHVPPPLLRRIDEKLEEYALLGTLFLFGGAGVCTGFLLFHRVLLAAHGWMIAPANIVPAAIAWFVFRRLSAVRAGFAAWGDRLLFAHVRMSPAQWLIAAGALYAAGFAVGGLAH
jgi:hypothetical protein